MAFVRKRGGCIQVLASVWHDGRSHQRLLCTLPSGSWVVDEDTKYNVSIKHPDLDVDWANINKQLLDACDPHYPLEREHPEIVVTDPGFASFILAVVR